MHKSRVAAAVVGLEGVACIVAGIGFVVAAIVGHPHDRATAVVLGVLLGVYGVGVVLVGRGLDRGRSWARTPAFLVQFFALVVAWYQRDTLPAITAVLAVVALAAIVALARAQTRHHT